MRTLRLKSRSRIRPIIWRTIQAEAVTSSRSGFADLAGKVAIGFGIEGDNAAAIQDQIGTLALRRPETKMHATL
jgi:hypothetical protein